MVLKCLGEGNWSDQNDQGGLSHVEEENQAEIDLFQPFSDILKRDWCPGENKEMKPCNNALCLPDLKDIYPNHCLVLFCQLTEIGRIGMIGVTAL